MTKSNRQSRGWVKYPWDLSPNPSPTRRGESSSLFLVSAFRLCSCETLAEGFEIRVKCDPGQQQDEQTTSMETGRSPSFECLQTLSCFMFVCPHCDRIRYDKNAQAPCERNPNVITDRLSREQGTNRIDDGGDRLVFGKSTDN